MRYFNTAGPCRPDDHYMLSVLDRLPGVRELIDRKSYFVLYAPRQIGKTTTMMQLARELTAEGRYTSVVLSMEAGAPFRNDPGTAEGAILTGWRADCAWLRKDLQPPPWPQAETGGRIREALRFWAQASLRPLVLFLDEIDALEDETLISVLRQLRSGYPHRPEGFPWSLALIGMRDVRDYKVASGGSEWRSASTFFNIQTESFTLPYFTLDEVAALYRQHTDETGQIFTDEAIRYAFEVTQGHPRLVNLLAREAVEKLTLHHTEPITVRTIEQAKESLIEHRKTHFADLIEQSKDKRIGRIIQSVEAEVYSHPETTINDFRLAQDLGLIRHDRKSGFVFANPLYREIVSFASAAVERT